LGGKKGGDLQEWGQPKQLRESGDGGKKNGRTLQGEKNLRGRKCAWV